MFIAFGLGALYLGRNLAPGTTVRMGPGWVPHALSYIMLVLGAIISAVALFTGGETVEAPKWKPITMVTIGIVCFGLLFESTGLIPALVALVLIASWGGDEFKLTEVIGNMVALAVLCILVFKVGLGMNIYVLKIAGW